VRGPQPAGSVPHKGMGAAHKGAPGVAGAKGAGGKERESGEREEGAMDGNGSVTEKDPWE